MYHTKDAGTEEKVTNFHRNQNFNKTTMFKKCYLWIAAVNNNMRTLNAWG